MREMPSTTLAASLLPRAASRARSKLSRSRSEEHTSELQSLTNLVCRLLLEKKNKIFTRPMKSLRWSELSRIPDDEIESRNLAVSGRDWLGNTSPRRMTEPVKSAPACG